MPGYFTVTIPNGIEPNSGGSGPAPASAPTPASGPAPAPLSGLYWAHVVLTSYEDFKGTVFLEYECVKTGGTDPTLSTYSESMYLDPDDTPPSGPTVYITGEPAFTFTATGTSGTIVDSAEAHRQFT